MVKYLKAIHNIARYDILGWGTKKTIDDNGLWVKKLQEN